MPLSAVGLTHRAGNVTSSHYELITRFAFEVELRGFSFVGSCMDVVITNTEVDVLLSTAKASSYEEWTCM